MLRVIGIEDNDLVALIHQCHERDERSLRQPVGHNDLFRTDRHRVAGGKLIGKRTPQRCITLHVAVVNLAGLQRAHCRILDVLWCVVIGPTQFEMDQTFLGDENGALVTHPVALRSGVGNAAGQANHFVLRRCVVRRPASRAADINNWGM